MTDATTTDGAAPRNPAVYKERLVGEYVLHWRGPVDAWERYHEVGPTRF
ncbi:hypothetical protein [Curtobacterium oceanosedimentum]|nr:hypothetical protein [Curtobacterium oceanosedimentum]